MNHRIALEERTGVMKKAKDNVWKDLLGIIGAFLSFYGFSWLFFYYSCRCDIMSLESNSVSSKGAAV